MSDPAASTVTLVLVEGDRKGPIIARLAGWETHAASFARIDWFKALNHAELGPLLEKPGVYVLDGRSPDLVRPRAYVGRADVLRSRLNSHLSSPQKAWWERAYVFAGGLSPTSTAWLEAELIEVAKRADRATVENGPSPRKPHLSWGDEQSMIQYGARARLLFGLLGLSACDPPSAPSSTPDSPPLGATEPTPERTGRNVYIVVGEKPANWRRWENWVRHGFVSGGGSASIGKAMDKIKTGDRVFAYLSGHGYLGIGVAMADAAPVDHAQASDEGGNLVPVLDLPFGVGRAPELHLHDPALAERAVRVRWLKTAARDAGFFQRGIFTGQMTTCTLHDKATIASVLSHFGLSPAD